jgi:hypothetical protein
MSEPLELLQERLRRWVLIIGVAQVLFGCFVGFIPPAAVAWFRGIVMAHVEFTANGVLMIAIGLLARELRLGAGALRVWFWALVIGTWTNGAAGIVGAFAGQSSRMMPTLNQAFPAPGGLDSPLVTGLLVVCGVTIVTALVLSLVGLIRATSRSTGAVAYAYTSPRNR